tara:strand:- start:5214 stop:5633 length:420 start_codon:yes stop_codon:yes gene_type:complete
MEKQRRYDIAYINMALDWAKLSYAKRKRVGALLVKNGMIISDGYNGTPSGFDNKCEDENNKTLWYVLHAEANALMKVARSTQSAEGSTLYVTLSPCKECSKLIFQAGVKRVVYCIDYKDSEGIDLLNKAGVKVEKIIID